MQPAARQHPTGGRPFARRIPAARFRPLPGRVGATEAFAVIVAEDDIEGGQLAADFLGGKEADAFGQGQGHQAFFRHEGRPLAKLWRMALSIARRGITPGLPALAADAAKAQRSPSSRRASQ